MSDSPQDEKGRRYTLTFTLPPSRVLARYGLAALAVIIVIALLLAAGSALTPFIFGLVLAYLIMPIVNRLNKRMPRWAAILVVYAIGLLIIVALIVFLVPPLVSQFARLIVTLSTPEELRRIVDSLLASYQANVPPTLRVPIEQLAQRILPSLQDNLSTIVTSIGAFLFRQVTQAIGLLSFLVGFVIVPIWLFYVLNSARRARLSLNRLISYRMRADFWNAWGLIDRSLSAFLRGQFTLGLIIGAAVWLGLVVLDFIPGIDIDYILLLAIWAGIAELVPMVGALLGAVPATIVALFVGGPISALAVLALFIVIQFVENNFLVPRVIGESVDVHPAILLVALVVFGQVLGFIGVILAAPITAILRDLYLYAYRRLSGKTPAEAVESISIRAERKAREAAEV